MGLVFFYWIKPRDNLGTNEVCLRPRFIPNFLPIVFSRRERPVYRPLEKAPLLTLSLKLFPDSDRGPGLPRLHNLV
jgi:hypothetical protein